MSDHKNDVVLVTGSTTGLGWEIAHSFVAGGAKVIFHGLSEPGKIRPSIQPLGTAFYFPADLSNPSEIEHLFKEIEQNVGTVDVLINNAGIQHVCPIDEFPVEKWNQIIATNLSACFHTIRLSLPSMKKKNYGRIINISSAHGLVASAGKSAYVAAKHGLIGLTKSVSLETARMDITCNAICPGWIFTELVKKQIERLAAQEKIDYETAKKRLLLEKQPSGNFVTAEEVASLCLFLAARKTKEIRGSSISIDGGWTAV